MLLLVGWSGQQTSWPTDVEHVESPPVCHFVLTAFKQVTIQDTISTCLGAKLVVPVTVGMLML